MGWTSMLGSKKTLHSMNPILDNNERTCDGNNNDGNNDDGSNNERTHDDDNNNNNEGTPHDEQSKCISDQCVAVEHNTMEATIDERLELSIQLFNLRSHFNLDPTNVMESATKKEAIEMKKKNDLSKRQKRKKPTKFSPEDVKRGKKSHAGSDNPEELAGIDTPNVEKKITLFIARSL
ncbi:integrator complex subunit 5-like protein [Benincasa hispida]|uniref:integrator complex subunit 5-like protein n=1 Tax=Benincasa hispida TaxID=102211 RepID=UPI001901D05B|nr:integrator complex subunit 5-like protein [Benincasa hispida]